VRSGQDFFNLYNHDLVRAAVAVPAVRVADPAFNARQVAVMVGEAVERHAIVALFPELCLSAYSCDDLFHQGALLEACEDALRELVETSRTWPLVVVVGVPLAIDQLLYNCAAAVCQGRILGVIPKTYLPNYREFYEPRQFASADGAHAAGDLRPVSAATPRGPSLVPTSPRAAVTAPPGATPARTSVCALPVRARGPGAT
jgi:NAD+ synthase (glutamine-hydrolysing)